MLKVKGKWLSPGEVEDCLLQHPAVAEAAVVGVPNRAGLVEPVAWVVPTEAGSAPDAGSRHAEPSELAAALREFVASRLASYKAPAATHLVDALPRTHLGKVDRAALRRAGGVAQRSSSSTMTSPLRILGSNQVDLGGIKRRCRHTAMN